MQPGSWRSAKQSSTARGYGYKWQQARKDWLEQHPFCVMCLREWGIQATDKAEVIVECANRGMAPPWAKVVDHVTPHRGDMHLFWRRSNWQSLCKPHHDSTKQREDASST